MASVGNKELAFLGEEVLWKQGSYRRVSRFFRGWHPQVGVLHFGMQGRETIVEEDVITAIVVFEVKGEDPPIPSNQEQ